MRPARGAPRPTSARAGDELAKQKSGHAAIAGRYATALYELADEAKALDAVAADLKAVAALIGEAADVARFLRSPVLGRDAQAKGIALVLEQLSAHALTRKFLGVVAANRRLFAVPAMIDAYLSELARRRGELTAEVASARPLTPEQEQALIAALHKAEGKKVSLIARVDPSLLGGLQVRIGSRLVDSSLKTKLQRLQLAMKGVA